MNKPPKVKEQILLAAIEAVAENRFNGNLSNHIAKKAQVSAATVNYHFDTKEDLAEAMTLYLEDIFRRQRLQSMQGEADDLRGQLHGFFAQKQETILREGELDHVVMELWCKAQAKNNPSTLLYDHYMLWKEHIIQTILKADENISTEQARVTAEMMVSMMLGANLQFLAEDDISTLETYFAACLEMLVAFLGNIYTS